MGRLFFGCVGNPSVQVNIGGFPQANQPKMNGKKQVLCDFGFAHMASRSYVAGLPCSRAGLMLTPAQKMH